MMRADIGFRRVEEKRDLKWNPMNFDVLVIKKVESATAPPLLQ